jgi:hypothetical protein
MAHTRVQESAISGATAPNRGRLKYGNPGGDLSAVPRSGAMNRMGLPCRRPARRNGRCRLHGGLSAGPRTPAGLEAIRSARTIHGFYAREVVEERRRARAAWRAMLQLLGR